MVKLDLDLDPDPHSEKLLDPDPHKMNADPQSWLKVINIGSGFTHKSSAPAPKTDFDTKHFTNLNLNLKPSINLDLVRKRKKLGEKRFTQCRKIYLVLYLLNCR